MSMQRKWRLPQLPFKFLIDADGHPVKRFASDVTPLELVSYIHELTGHSSQTKRRHSTSSSLSRQLNELLLADG